MTFTQINFGGIRVHLHPKNQQQREQPDYVIVADGIIDSHGSERYRGNNTLSPHQIRVEAPDLNHLYTVGDLTGHEEDYAANALHQLTMIASLGQTLLKNDEPRRNDYKDALRAIVESLPIPKQLKDQIKSIVANGEIAQLSRQDANQLGLGTEHNYIAFIQENPFLDG